MAHETVAQKAVRLLSEGRVRVLRADRNVAQVAVRGDSGRYLVTVSGGDVDCACASVRPCSHARAAALVTAAGLPVESELR